MTATNNPPTPNNPVQVKSADAAASHAAAAQVKAQAVQQAVAAGLEKPFTAGKFELPGGKAGAKLGIAGKKKRIDEDEADPRNAPEDAGVAAVGDAAESVAYGDGHMLLAQADTSAAGAGAGAGGGAAASTAVAEAGTGAAAGTAGAAAGTGAAAAGISTAGMIAIGAAAVGVAAASGGGGGAAVASATGFVLSGSVVAGAVTNGAGLTVGAYKADGTLLAGGTAAVNNNGSFTLTITENYSGPVLIRVVDTSAGADYTDEGTGVAKDLGVDLRAVTNVSGNGTITVNVTPLTELAVRELTGDAGGDAGTSGTTLGASVTTTQVTAANTAVKEAFGLTTDIVTTAPVTVDASATPNAYGQVLAAIAGAEANLGADTGTVLNTLAQGISGSTMDQSVSDLLLAGATTADAVPTNLADVSTALDTLIGGNVSALDISADTGNTNDFVTQTAAQTITATLDAALGTNKLWGSVNGGTTWTDISSSVAGTGLTWTGVTLSGSSSIKLAVTASTVTGFTGSASSVVGDIATQSYRIDTAAPSFTSAATADFAENGTGTAYKAVATDANLVTYSLGGADVASFSIDPNSGAVRFNASPNFESAQTAFSIDVTATDGAGNTATQAVAITVKDVNETPTITSTTTASFAENGTGMVYCVSATDPDAGATLTYALAGTDAALFDIVASTGIVTFKTAPNYEAPGDAGANNVYDITVTASDGTNTTAAQAVAITVTNVNEMPTFTSGTTASFAENVTGTTVYTAAATDQDAGTTLSYALAGADAALFNFDSATGAVTFKNAPNREAPVDSGANNVYDITVTASDGTNTTSAQAVAITVANVNEAPTSSPATSSATLVINQSVTDNVSNLFADVDVGDTLTYTQTGLPTGMSLSSAGALSGSPTSTGSATVVFTATDSGGLTATHTVSVSVVSAPVFTGVIANVAQAKSGDTLTLTAAVTEAVTVTGTPTLTFDVGGQSMTATYTGGSDTNALTFSATAPAGDDTTVTVSSISLGGGLITGKQSGQELVTTSTGQTITGFIIDNSNPAFTSAATASPLENQTAAYSAAATDATVITYALGGADAALFGISSSTGAVTFNAAPNREAPTDSGGNNVYDITVTATDALGHAASQNVAITVANFNEAPSITGGATSTATLAVNQAFSNNITGLFSDVDGDTLTYSATGLPTGVALSAGVISGTPTATGTASVVITATDGGNLTASHTVTVTVVSAPTLGSTIDNVTNFDVTSNIVLTASENVTAAANKNITIVNDGGTGFHGEATVNTQIIAANDTTKVTISGSTITINPGFDLDFNNDYHIMVDAGAFLGVTSGQVSVVTADATAMNFSTVNPLATSTAATSSKMSGDTIVSSYGWWDAEGNGAPGGASVIRDFSNGDFAIVGNDLATTGIATNDFYIAVNNFAAGDLIYVDNHGANAVQRQSDFNNGLIIDMGSAPTQVITGASGTTTGLNGGQFDVTLASSTASFTDTTALKVLLGNVAYEPILYG